MGQATMEGSAVANVQKDRATKAKKGCEIIRTHIEGKTPELQGFRSLVRDRRINATQGLDKESKRRFKKVLVAMLDEVSTDEFEEATVRTIEKAQKGLVNAKVEELAVILNITSPEEKKAIILNFKDDKDSIIHHRNDAPFKLMRAQTRGSRITKNERALKAVADAFQKEFSTPEFKENMVSGIRQITEAVVYAAVAGVKAVGDISTMRYAQVAAGLLESRMQAEQEILDAGPVQV